MTTDPTPLQERIARVLHEIDPVSGHGHDWRKLSNAERKFYIHKAAAVLPIIREAQAEAWDEGRLSGEFLGIHANPYIRQENR